jgi:hypothetical protein
LRKELVEAVLDQTQNWFRKVLTLKWKKVEKSMRSSGSWDHEVKWLCGNVAAMSIKEDVSRPNAKLVGKGTHIV